MALLPSLENTESIRCKNAVCEDRLKVEYQRGALSQSFESFPILRARNVRRGSDVARQQLLDLKAKFIQQFSDQSAYIEYSAPQFKLRVGDFKTHGEADLFLSQVRIYFSSAFIVPDKIVIEGVEW